MALSLVDLKALKARLLRRRGRGSRAAPTPAKTVPTPTLAQRFAKISDQFRELDREDPGSWPPLPQYAACSVVTVIVFALLWFVWLTDAADAQDRAKQKEATLRSEFSRKLGPAANIDALRKQREQAILYVTQLEKQLPSRAEMDALLSDVNRAGMVRRLQFESFRPGQVAVREYYAELPISLRLTGRFSDVGAFAADVASLSRIVTLDNLSIQPVREGSAVILDATVRTYRYLDESEAGAQKPAAGPKK